MQGDVLGLETIRSEHRGRVLVLTLDRPDRMNAINEALHRDLARVFRAAQNDRGSDVVVLTGGGPAFSAGGDFDWLLEAAEKPHLFDPIMVEAKEIIFSMLDLEKPLVAAVNGHAAGLGATIALFSDVIFLSEEARIIDPHVRIGLVAGDGGAVIWPQLIGFARAKHYLMTGEPVKAAEAHAMGLVNTVLPADRVLDEALAYAEKLAKGSLPAIRGTKISVNIALKQLAHTIMDTSLAYEALSNAHPDHREGLMAMREKRAPVFGQGHP